MNSDPATVAIVRHSLVYGTVKMDTVLNLLNTGGNTPSDAAIQNMLRSASSFMESIRYGTQIAGQRVLAVDAVIAELTVSPIGSRVRRALDSRVSRTNSTVFPLSDGLRSLQSEEVSRAVQYRFVYGGRNELDAENTLDTVLSPSYLGSLWTQINAALVSHNSGANQFTCTVSASPAFVGTPFMVANINDIGEDLSPEACSEVASASSQLGPNCGTATGTAPPVTAPPEVVTATTEY